MVVPVLAAVLIVAALTLVVIGVLAATHRLRRNRLIGVRTGWTLARVDAFRRANRVAAPAFVASGVVGLAGGVGALLAPVTAAAATLLVVGTLGLLVLLGVGGTVGARFAEADRAETLEAENRPAQPCMPPESVTVPDEACGPAASSCAGSCAICPRAGAAG
ncbi:SdpI family protein [Actinomycetospora atypica]|uniref:SdpI family protein n=1 Tax=Actinomycetospora atypica TaxID=1290095 RepID=A0ABV9YVQ6_9PSEU